MSSEPNRTHAARLAHLGHRRAAVPASAPGADLALRLHHRGEELPVPAARLHHQMVRRRLVRAARYLAAALSLAQGRRDRHRARADLRHARRGARCRAPSSSAARRSRCCSFCRSRCPASSPAYRCARPSTSWASISRSGPSSWATPPSASWSSTTTPSRGSGGCPAISSRRPWISAPTASRPSAM